MGFAEWPYHLPNLLVFLNSCQWPQYRAPSCWCIGQRNLSSAHGSPAGCWEEQVPPWYPGLEGENKTEGSFGSRAMLQQLMGIHLLVKERGGKSQCRAGGRDQWCSIGWMSGIWRCKIIIGKPPGGSALAEHTGLFILWKGESLCFWNCALVNNLERYENSEFICSWIVWIFSLLCHTHPQQYFLY